MRILKYFIFILFFLSTGNVSARENDFQKDSTIIPHNFLEFGLGTGLVNSRLTMAAGVVNIGYKNAVVTMRLCRSSGDAYRGYIFEDAFLMGYRFNFCNYFATTISAGYSDLAFEKGYHTYFDATPDMFSKTNGISLEAEAEYKIPFHNKISPFSFSAIYYSTFNSRMNLNGVLVALKFCFDRYGKHWYSNSHTTQ